MLEARPTLRPTTVWSPGRSRFTSHLRRPGLDRGHRQGGGRLGVAILLSLPGCGVAPSVNILGSFFPAWLICIVAGVVLTILTRQVFVAITVLPWFYVQPDIQGIINPGAAHQFGDALVLGLQFGGPF